ncbi:MAG: hypothetical protein M3063_08345 [Actinomycetota bacterium]|nr:hypothetical protein [Actinomycetota bacterium]
MGYLVIGRIDYQPLDPSDLPVDRVDTLAASDGDLTERHFVIGDEMVDWTSPAKTTTARPSRSEAVVGPGQQLPQPISSNADRTGKELGLLCLLQLGETCQVTAESHRPVVASTISIATSRPDPCRCFGSTTRWVTGPRDRVYDHPADLAALTVTAADFNTDRKLRQLCHSALLDRCGDGSNGVQARISASRHGPTRLTWCCCS